MAERLEVGFKFLKKLEVGGKSNVFSSGVTNVTQESRVLTENTIKVDPDPPKIVWELPKSESLSLFPYSSEEEQNKVLPMLNGNKRLVLSRYEMGKSQYIKTEKYEKLIEVYAKINQGRLLIKGLYEGNMKARNERVIRGSESFDILEVERSEIQVQIDRYEKLAGQFNSKLSAYKEFSDADWRNLTESVDTIWDEERIRLKEEKGEFDKETERLRLEKSTEEEREALSTMRAEEWDRTYYGLIEHSLNFLDAREGRYRAYYGKNNPEDENGEFRSIEDGDLSS